MLRTPNQRRQSQLSPNELTQLQQAFHVFDTDHDGVITITELQTVMHKLGQEPTREELQDMINDMDENGDGEIDFKEFVTLMERRLSLRSQQNEFEEAFSVFDRKGDGRISFGELKEVLTDLGEEVTDDDVRDMIAEADTTGSGYIDKQEFMAMMLGGGGFLGSPA